MIINYTKYTPKIDESCFIADSAAVIGNVTIDKGASVWFGAVIRGDMAKISIGKNTNVQDNAVIHVSPMNSVTIGEGVTIGHNAIVHGATIGNNVLVGMGSTVLDGAVIGDNCIIGAGAVVTSGTVIPDDSLVLGIPAKAEKKISTKQIASTKMNALSYYALAKTYKKEQQ